MSYVKDPEHVAWILRQEGELDRRVAAVRALIAPKNDGRDVQDINLFDLELARQDLMALLNAMQPSVEDDEDF